MVTKHTSGVIRIVIMKLHCKSRVDFILFTGCKLGTKYKLCAWSNAPKNNEGNSVTAYPAFTYWTLAVSSHWKIIFENKYRRTSDFLPETSDNHGLYKSNFPLPKNYISNLSTAPYYFTEKKQLE